MLKPSIDSATSTLQAASPIAFLTFGGRLREISMLFDGTDRVHQAMRRLVNLFQEHQTPYAIVGGMAVNAHRHPRTTQDVDFLVRPEAIPLLQQFVSDGVLLAEPGRARRFRESATGVQLDFLVAGSFPGSGMPGPIAFPDPLTSSELLDDFRVVDLRTLIELKLAAHRYQDFADVVNLIRVHHLDEAFANGLHESIASDFIECLDEQRREDKHERRQNDST